MRENLEMPQYTQAEDVLRLKYIKKILPKFREFMELKTLPKEITLEAENLFEFRFLLEILEVAEKDIVDTIAHENAHGNKAASFESEGIKHLGYMVKINISKDGKTILTPQCKLDIPDEFRELKEEHKEILKSILSAPWEYGDKLSVDDFEMINKLSK